MKKVLFFVEEMAENQELVFATMFVGVMDDETIYAKRDSCRCDDDPEYIQVSIKDTEDATSRFEGLKEDFVARDMMVSENDGLEDSRIIIEPEISEEIMAAILAAIEENDKE